MMTAQQSEVVAVQKEVAAVDTHLVEVDDGLTNLTGRYNATVGLVEIMESSITTTITRVNHTEVRVSLVEEKAKNNSASLLDLAMALTHKQAVGGHIGLGQRDCNRDGQGQQHL